VYVIPLILLLVVALSFLASPILAVIIAIPCFLGFLAFVGLRRRADETVEAPATGDPPPERDDASGGIWGEKK
jgi:hypothetical protein